MSELKREQYVMVQVLLAAIRSVDASWCVNELLPGGEDEWGAEDWAPILEKVAEQVSDWQIGNLLVIVARLERCKKLQEQAKILKEWPEKE